MKLLSKSIFSKVEKQIYKNARPLDISLFEFEFKQGSKDNVLYELQKYQNEDGGFGKGLEPDIQSELSSPIATTYAFQYFHKLSIDKLPNFLKQALDYFDSTIIKERLQWHPISQVINKKPSAPWWIYDEEKYANDDSWGNPTVEIFGYMIKYSGGLSNTVKDEFQTKIFDRLLNRKNIETHELQCYQRLYNLLPDSDKIKIRNKLVEHIDLTVEGNTKKWTGYITKPLTFITNSDSLVYPNFKELINYELDTIIESFDEYNICEPSWEWGTYPDTWEKVKKELIGMLTVKNLIILRHFDRIEK